MASAIHTRPFELSPTEYAATMIALLRRRMIAFDILAAVIVVLIARYMVLLPWWQAAALFPFPIIIGFVRMPWRVKKMANNPTTGRPVGRITFHVDEEGILYSSPSAEPVILKWDELRSIRLIGGNYVVDGGFDDFLVHPSAFATADDERRFQQMARERVKRIGGF
ncbi:MAG: hypothetical protein ACO1SV_23225 [Fimbriimonas sp.]